MCPHFRRPIICDRMSALDDTVRQRARRRGRVGLRRSVYDSMRENIVVLIFVLLPTERRALDSLV